VGGHGRVEEETRRLTERLTLEEQQRRRAVLASQSALASQASFVANAPVANVPVVNDVPTGFPTTDAARRIPGPHPLKRILVTFDGSLFSERALPYAEALGRMTGAEIIVTYSADNSDLVRLAGANPARATGDRVAVALERVRARLTASGLHARARIVYGSDPAQGVMSLQREHDADLIAIATHARQGVELAFLGSVASAIVRANPGYTLVTPPRSPDMRDRRVTFSRILLPLDGSELAESAIGVATTLLTQPAPSARPRRLTLLYVAESRAQEADGATYLSQIQAAIERETSARGTIFTKVRFGAPAETIVAEAGGAQAALPAIARYDLLLLATHGRGGLAKWFYGSVASYAIGHADTCILLARANP
jgi:nucleotide-binding universal stress UspA family protein